MFIAKLTNDVVFKFVFGSRGSEEPLRALLERGPDERIQQVEIINPGLGRDHLDDKAVVLDVRARDEKRGVQSLTSRRRGAGPKTKAPPLDAETIRECPGG